MRQKMFVCISILLTAFLLAPPLQSAAAFSPVTTTRQITSSQNSPFVRARKVIVTSKSAASIRLLLAQTSDDKSSPSTKTKGVYVRPSGAIERGSGFFFPGLEGPRVRLLFGGILLFLTALNHVLIQETSLISFSLEEQIAVVYSLLILFQAAIEFGKEELIVEGGVSSNAAGKSGSSNASLLQKDLIQKWSTVDKLSQTQKDRIQWAAASYLSVTPATQMLLLSNDSILYRLGSDQNLVAASEKDSSSVEQGIRAALDQLSQSKGGRVALPATHPAVLALGLESSRTVVLQRISRDSCWVMSSADQLLASFTSADLKWLGQLARYINV